jgi:hypothetical protein
MPPFKDKLTDQQVWELVWFLRSIGPESARPQGAGGAAASGTGVRETETESETP